MSERKRILVVSRSFTPMNSPRALRTTELVMELARQGYDVVLVTPKKPEHEKLEQTLGIKIVDLGRDRSLDIDINRGNYVSRIVKRAVRRGLQLFLDYPNIQWMFKVRKALKSMEGFDLMISIAAPHSVHWGTAWALKKNKSLAGVWVADCGDPFYHGENDTFKVPFYFKYLEHFFCNRADYIAVPFEGARKGYFQEYQNKIKVIPQGFRFPKLHLNGRTSKNGVATFGYFGNISSYRHYAIPFLTDLNQIKQEFRFIVYTRREDLFNNILNRSTLDKCDIREYVPREELLEKIAEVDFLIHFPYENGIQRSLKLIDYSFLNKPVLSYKADELSKEKFLRFLEGDYSGKEHLENYENYEIKKVTNLFLELGESWSYDEIRAGK